MKTVLVTGGAGFIGSHLCERLVQRGDRVVCYDNFDPYYDVGIKERNLAALVDTPGFTLVRGDIREAGRLTEVLRETGADHVVHLAALAGVRPSLESPALYQEVNVAGTTNVLEAARKAGIRSVVMASSSSVYGANEKTPFHEDDPVCAPISPYAASKRAAELAGYVHHHLYDMDVICHRFFTVYGPRQRPDMAIAKFTQRVMRGQPIEMFGDGSTRRDYTFVDDVVDGIVASVDRAHGLGFQIFNLGNSETIALSDLIASIGRVVGREPIIETRPEQRGDVTITSADIEKAARLLGYAPQTRIEDGLFRYHAWLWSQGGSGLRADAKHRPAPKARPLPGTLASRARAAAPLLKAA